jgi:hypothetical protein
MKKFLPKIVALKTNHWPSSLYLKQFICVLFISLFMQQCIEKDDPKVLTVSSTSINVGLTAGESKIKITTNTDWTATSDQSWCTLSASSGSGDSEITVLYTENTLFENRTAHVTIAGEGVQSQVITIKQNASTPSLVILPDKRDLLYAAGTTTVDILSNATWTATSDQTWCVISNPSGSKNGTLNISFTENATGSSRIAKVSLASPSIALPQILILTQNARGKWTLLKSFNNDPDAFYTYYNGLSVNGTGIVRPTFGSLAQSILQYNVTTNSWSQLTTFPEDPKYIRWGTYNNQIISISSTKSWRYDVTTNQWQSLSVPPIETDNPLYGILFNIESYFFYGLGEIDQVTSKQFWLFDPPSSSWSKLSDFPGSNTLTPLTLVYNQNAYLIGGGSHVNGIFQGSAEVWKYTPVANTWTRLSDYPGKGRSSMTGFVLDGKLYAGTGGGSGGFQNDFWELNPLTNEWKQVKDFPLSADYMFAFTIGTKAYVGGGRKANGSNYDIWSFEK